MATIVITMSAAASTRIVNAICANNGYQTLINGSPNPQTKADFAKQWLGTIAKQQVMIFEGNVAMSTALTATQADADTNILIT